MYEEHLRSEVQRRKEQRQLNKMSRSKVTALNKSAALDQAHNSRENQSVPRSPPVYKPETLTYSKLFNIKRPTVKISTHSSLTREPDNHFQASKMPRGIGTTPIREQPLEYSTVREEGSKSRIREEPRREWVTDSGNPSIWMTRLRSDS